MNCCSSGWDLSKSLDFPWGLQGGCRDSYWYLWIPGNKGGELKERKKGSFLCQEDKNSVSLDRHLISLVETSHCPPLSGKVGEQLLAGHNANPHGISLLIKENEKVSSSHTSLSPSVPQSASYGDEAIGPERLSNFTYVSKLEAEPGLTGHEHMPCFQLRMWRGWEKKGVFWRSKHFAFARA